MTLKSAQDVHLRRLNRGSIDHSLGEVSPVNDPVCSVDIRRRITAQIRNEFGDFFAAGESLLQVFVEQLRWIDDPGSDQVIGDIGLNRCRADRIDSDPPRTHLNGHRASHRSKGTLCAGVGHEIGIPCERIYGADVDDYRIARASLGFGDLLQHCLR